MASNYEVNIKLNTRTVNKQLNNLEKRISKLNKLAVGGRASKTVLQNEKTKIDLATKRLQIENRNLRTKQRQLKIDRQQLKVEQQTAAAINKQTKVSKRPRVSGSPMGPSSPLNFTNQGTLLPGKGFTGGGNKNVLSGALISGAFPLLFGQGLLGGAVGAAGGAIGGMLGGQTGGFAGGLVATAVLSQVQAFVDSSSKLGQAMSSLTPDTNALAQAMGIVGTQEEKRIQAIEKLNGKQAALTAAMDKMRETIGDEATDRLKAFGESTRLIGNEFAIAMTKMQAALLPVINLVDRFLGISKGAKDSERARAIKNSTNPEILRIQSEIAALENKTGGGRSGSKQRSDKIKELKAELKVLGDQEVVTNKIAAKNETDRLTLEASLRATTDKTKFLQDTLQFGEQEAEIRQRILQFERDSGVVLDANGKQRIRDAMELERSLQRQVEFTKAIGQSFRDSFRDAITGATSFNQAMVNVLNTIRDRLIGMYLDQMFAQATTGGGGGFLGKLFGGLVGGIFGGGGAGAAVAPLITDKVFDTTFDTSLISAGSLAGKFANGGFAQKGKSYLVGERGPELFTPGATGGQISPMGSTNIVVNVDASGSSVQGNEEQSKVLGQVLASAIQSELIKQKRPGGLLS